MQDPIDRAASSLLLLANVGYRLAGHRTIYCELLRARGVCVPRFASQSSGVVFQSRKRHLGLGTFPEASFEANVRAERGEE